jgi:S-layer protein
MAVSFTQGNDFIVPTEDGQTYLGGAGNDTYMLSSATVAAGATIVIQDTEGTNKIQLVDGLEIASSTVFNNALELTLSNGAVIQIVGASSFGYDVGGNALLGTEGTQQTFTELVEDTLGTTVPAEGEDPTTGGEVTIDIDPEPEAPTFTVTAEDVEEGGVATFTITLSEAQAEETTVDYAISLEGDTSAADHGDITVDSVVDNTGSGTLTFAAGETTKIITIPVTEDDLSPEEGEGITVTLSNPTGADAELGEAAAATADIIDVPVTFELTQDTATVQEGDTVIYTLTASTALSEDTVFDFTVVPGDVSAADQGTNDTNLNDFNQGAFNPSQVTILAGQTTATFSLITVDDDLTELPEDYTVQAELDGEVVATYETTLLDGGSADGGQTYTLTTAADDVPGTSGNDTVNGEDTTLTPFDEINGGDGTDTMNLVFDAAYDFDADAAGAIVTSIEEVQINAAAVGVTGDISGWTGLNNLNINVAGASADIDLTSAAAESVTAKGSQDITLQDATATMFDITATDADDVEDDLVNITAASMTSLSLNVAEGTAVTLDTDSTALAIDLDGFNDTDGTPDNGDVTILDNSDATAGIVEDLTLNVNDDFGLDLDFAQATSLAVAGDSELDLAITDLGALESLTVSESAGFDADVSGIASLESIVSTSTGDIVVTVAATALEVTTADGDDQITLSAALGATQAIATGAGDDTVVLFNAAPTVGASVDGGDGDSDILGINVDQIGADHSDVISNFEILQISGAVGAVALDVADFDDVQNVIYSDGYSGAATITGFDSDATFTANAASGGTLAVTVTDANDPLNTEDILNVNLVPAAAAAFGVITAADVEIFNVTVGSTGAAGDDVTLTGIGGTDLVTLNIFQGDFETADIVITNALTSVETIDASGMGEGGVTVDLTGNANDATITTADGDDVITVADANNTISLGDGDATVIAGDGDNTITGGESATGNAGGDVTVGDGNNTITLGDGGWTVTVGTGENAITTGAGDDIIEIGASVGLNTVDVGTGDDQIVLLAAPSAAGAYASVTGLDADDIIDFSAATAGNGAAFTGTLGAKITLGGAAGFANYLDSAASDTTDVDGNDALDEIVIKWFQYEGNTYVVADSSVEATFQDGVDSVVELVGLVDLSDSTVAADVLTIV